MQAARSERVGQRDREPLSGVGRLLRGEGGLLGRLLLLRRQPDVDEAKAAALRSAVAGSDVGLSPKEKQAAKQAAFAAKQAADSAKGFSISLPNPF